MKNIDVNALYYNSESFANNLLETVNIGSKVTSINKSVFKNNQNLSLITMHSAYTNSISHGEHHLLMW